MFLLILESLGSTELLFILVMALIFFGPRKLPQISRSLGKSLAEFRKASEDFKTTWAREVNLEDTSPASTTSEPLRENSILTEGEQSQSLEAPKIEAVAPERVVPRHAGQSIDHSETSGQFDDQQGESQNWSDRASS